MALSVPTLSAAIKAKRLSKLAADQRVDNAAMTADCDAIAEAVIEHITAAAVVTIPAGVAVQVSVPSGTGATIAPGVGAIT